jgi:hypothetical protein
MTAPIKLCNAAKRVFISASVTNYCVFDAAADELVAPVTVFG